MSEQLLVTIMDGFGVCHVFRIAKGASVSLSSLGGSGTIISIEPITPETEDLNAMVGESEWSVGEPWVWEAPEPDKTVVTGVDLAGWPVKIKPAGLETPKWFDEVAAQCAPTQPSFASWSKGLQYTMEMSAGLAGLTDGPAVKFRAAAIPGGISRDEQEARELMVWVEALAGRAKAEQIDRDVCAAFAVGNETEVVKALRLFIENRMGEPACIR